MMAQSCYPVTYLKCIFLAFFFCSSFVVKAPASLCDPRDSLALKEFANNLTVGSITTAWSSSSDCCRWDGVVCEIVTDATVSSRVTKLTLSRRFLKGKISRSLAQLDELKWLDLSLNNLEGELPAEFSKLKQLKYLDLSQNAISGPVSTALSGLQSIEVLNISSNMLNGDLLKLGNLENIVVFNISNNSFSGGFSSQICSSSTIQLIDLSMNHFYGGLAGLENCSKSLQELHFDDNTFSGPLPESLYSMSALKQLTVSENYFSSQLSEKLGMLPNLETLVVSGNNFSGGLPNVFGNLTRLQRLSAHSNLFSGPLPSTLALCVELRVLDLRNNSLIGPINLNFTNLGNLLTLELASNHFAGPFPDSLSHCNKLTTLSLAKNQFNGSIPENFANLTSLSFLSLSNNSFSNLSEALTILQNCKRLTTLILTRNFHGEEMPVIVNGFESLIIFALGNCGVQGQIPTWLSKCRSLEVLDLSWNRLEGSIPPWIGQMESLFYLDLSNNSLTGDIPTSLAGLRNLVSANCSKSDFAASAGIPLYVKRNQSANGLQYNHASSFPPSIFLNNNRLSGMVFPDISQLKGLHVLDLSNNNLSGTIPSSISEMENLETLDLSRNSLYGTIPPSLNKLTFLSKFNVAYNHLQGEIPSGGQFLSFPSSSFQGNIGLCGELYSPCKSIGFLGLKPHVVGSASKFGRVNILGIMLSVGIAVALLAAIVILRKSIRDVGDPINDFEEELGRPHKLSEAFGSSKLVLFQNSDCKDLTVAELLKSTNYFNQANIIGCGGFGLVYKANLPNGTKAAIKRLSGDCGQMEREFQAEVQSLSRAQHKNLVSLKGYCQHGNDRLLIYSYLENGSLDYWLHECVGGSSVLKWDMRLTIAQGAARGLAYLHKSCEPNIVHRDVKSSNILLDEKFEAHLADFGLSRLLQPYDTHVTTDLVGTLGYIPPEYSQTSTATCRGDVYSFGVVLLELLTGRRPVEVCKGKNCRDLVSWVFQMKSENREDEVFDSAIWQKDHKKQLLDVLSIACKCIDQDPRKRPSIVEVVSRLDNVRVCES